MAEGVVARWLHGRADDGTGLTTFMTGGTGDSTAWRFRAPPGYQL
jgi:hypothetical protein